MYYLYTYKQATCIFQSRDVILLSYPASTLPLCASAQYGGLSFNVSQVAAVENLQTRQSKKTIIADMLLAQIICAIVIATVHSPAQ